MALCCADYRLPAGMTQLPTDNPCLRYEFELRRLGRLGQLELAWQGESGAGELRVPSGTAPSRPGGPGLQ